MKRVLCFALCVSLILCFAGCKKNGKGDKIGIDVEYYAKLGKMPEFDYKLGDDGEKTVAEIRKELGDELMIDDGPYCEVYAGDTETEVELSGKEFIYDNKSKKITKIISYETAYEFPAESISIEIRDAMASYGFESEERALTDSENELFGMMSDTSALEYKLGDNYVLFVFYENALFATALYK